MSLHEEQPIPSSGRDDAEEFETPGQRSLLGDIGDLFEDGRTYVEAELAFQKTRGAYAAGQLKSALIYAVIALVLVFFAVLGITVGLIIALAPILTIWGSTALVAGVLLLGAALAALKLSKHARALTGAFKNKPGS
ncbi:phage holin family protein [Altererythrobacter xixiisoli]|uniref:Phage holin family protein n=1 Tax=Croceibacterium xixiisoli TaxID=1476466 RepID=A0A6I4TXG6_9SPHN|nr:phage holin family protein [Croceibacterium xixiisoli]MXP00866.1 phage holin family protein [Croceibacterium xixiisoli]